MNQDSPSQLRQLYPTKKIILIRGAFDILHVGHIRTFVEAKSLGDILVISLDADTVVKVRKPGRPIFNQELRREFLLQLKPIDYVYISNIDGGYDIIEDLKPHVLVVKDESDSAQSGAGSRSDVINFCNKLGIDVKAIKSKANSHGDLFSSTAILNRDQS